MMSQSEGDFSVNKSALRDKGWLKISDLAKRAGVSVSTIHYYVQEGLLTPPARTSRNMAYYDPACVEEIRTIQDLQTNRFLPLSAIRLLLKAGREGQAEEHIGEMRSVFENIFHPLVEKTQYLSMPREEFLKNTGLEIAALDQLEEQGIIVPRPAENGPLYDDVDFSLARIYKKLAALGLKPEDLKIYRQYIEFLVIEAKELHALIHRAPDHQKIPLIELFQTIRDFKEHLVTRIYRRETQQLHSQAAQ
jgi:DNA-binding transcriptional MerR regulator